MANGVEMSLSSKNLVAITGYSHRLPGGLDTDEDFWRLISQREIVQEPVHSRYGKGYISIGDHQSPARLPSPYEGLIRDDGVLMFDRSLFGISQFEEKNLNPLSRMLLTCTWKTLEHSGWDFRKLKNSPTGVFIGVQTPSFSNWRPMKTVNEFTNIEGSVAMIANRISYHFNLMGSSMAYCTACSAGISALHAALNALRCGDCEQALAGSVNYLGSANHSLGFSNLGVLSPDGKCHSFDASANGYMRSEGCFVMTLKPLEKAEHDGDRIFAVIESTAVNAAGAADYAAGLAPGRYITAPTRHAQISAINSARERANRAAREFSYVEAHATGTVVGDRIEGNAIAEAFGNCGRDVPLRVASVKSNIGHLEAAAFHASLMKVILMFQHRTFAPISKNYFEPNPDIDFESCPMQVQTSCEPFPDHQVVVGINSFGFGGANGHCIVSEYRPKSEPIWSVPLTPTAGYMIPLSARTPASLAGSVNALCEYMEREPIDMYTLAGNLARRRTHFTVRTSISAFNQQQLLERLREFDEEDSSAFSINQDGADRRIAMVFAGQGTQWAGCGRQLYKAIPVFQRVVDRIEEHWLEHAEFSLREACFHATQEQLNEVRLAQPAIFLVQCALFELLKTWGIYPEIVVGHSSGEVAAAYASGALTLPDAVHLIYVRSQLQQHTAGSGRMLAIGSDQKGVEQVLDDLQITYKSKNGQQPHVEFACFNSPASVVICGLESVLNQMITALDERNLQNHLLPGNIAFHSSAMDAIRDDVKSGLSFLDHCEFDCDVPFVSSVSGLVTDRLDSDYWWSNIRQPVRFADAINTIKTERPVDAFLEISPNHALQGMIAQCVDGLNPKPATISTLRRDADECIAFNETLGALYRIGIDLDFETQFPHVKPIAHQIPGHPMELQANIDPYLDNEIFLHNGPFAQGPLLGRRVYGNHLRFEAKCSELTMPLMFEHRVQSVPTMPAAGYIEMILEATQGRSVYIEQIDFLKPCRITSDLVRLQTELHALNGSTDEYAFSISTLAYEDNAECETHSRGHVKLLDEKPKLNVPMHLSEVDISEFRDALDDSDLNFYERVNSQLENKFQYGPNFQTLRRLKKHEKSWELLVDVEMDESLWETGNAEGYVLCPPLIDGALQCYLFLVMQATDLVGMPVSARQINFLSRPTTPKITVHVTRPDKDWHMLDANGQLTVKHGERTEGDMRFYDSATGELFMHMHEYVTFSSNPNWVKLPDSRHVIDWQPKFHEPIVSAESERCAALLDPEGLIVSLGQSDGGQPRVLHIVELAHNRSPDRTMLNKCSSALAARNVQVEYWLVNDTADQTQACYNAFNLNNSSIRFATYDRAQLTNSDLTTDLLRNSAAHILLLHRDREFSDEDWALYRRLSVAGGLALVCDEHEMTELPGSGWLLIDKDSNKGMSLFQAPQTLMDSENDVASSELRLVIGSTDGLASNWLTALGQPDDSIVYVQSISDGVERLEELHENSVHLPLIDLFVDTCPQDPTGEKICARFVELLQVLIFSSSSSCRINVVTQNAVIDVHDLDGAFSIWGAVRSVASELGSESGFLFRLVDVGSVSDLDTLLWLDRNDIREREIAIRDGRLWVPRLVNLRDRFPNFTKIEDIDDVAYYLAIENPGQISGLGMTTYQLPDLSDHDVEVDVEYAGLNFRDVIVTLDMLPALAYERSKLGEQLGMEASGVVRRVGVDVHQYQVGDRVLLTQGGCIANRVVVDENMVFAKPDNLSMHEAASVLSVYCTAYYALIHLARLGRGQKILVHSAMGGVGQAAIQLANNVGAQIYATAGSDAKRRQLVELGASAVFDSHSHEWYDQLMEETAGEGVDVILNSLAGKHLSLCIQALRPGGWHCEIGKVDIYADNALSLKAFRKNIRFVAIDVDRLMCDDPTLTRSISEACLELLATGEIRPVATTIFDYKDYGQAFRLMINGQHQGKLVLKAPQSVEDTNALEIIDRRPFLNPNATYLITGGFGGIGLRLLSFLSIKGARHVTLMDRNPRHGRTVEWVIDRSAVGNFDLDLEIDIVPGDVSNADDVESCIAKLTRPLKGVFHLAGVLDDSMVSDMTAASFSKVFEPKALGALNLHNATRQCELDHFVMISSLSSVYGGFGQTNYSAANAYLDSLAIYRHRIGLPALSCNFPGVVESGMLARDKDTMRFQRASGIPPVSAAFIFGNLDYAMRKMTDNDHLLTALFESPPWTFDSSEYMRSGRCLSNRNAYRSGIGNQQTIESVMEQITDKIAELCGHNNGTVDEPLASFGLTSISVAELGAFIRMEFNHQVSALDLMTTSTCRSIAQSIMSDSENIQSEQSEHTSDEVIATVSNMQQTRQKPSEFAHRYEDHFPSDFNRTDYDEQRIEIR